MEVIARIVMCCSHSLSSLLRSLSQRGVAGAVASVKLANICTEYGCEGIAFFFTLCRASNSAQQRAGSRSNLSASIQQRVERKYQTDASLLSIELVFAFLGVVRSQATLDCFADAVRVKRAA